MTQNGNLFITAEDKELLENSCKQIIGILNKYCANEQPGAARSVLQCAQSNASFLKDCIDFLETFDDGKHYRCYANNQRIDITECRNCHAVSCPVNTGNVDGPEPIGG